MTRGRTTSRNVQDRVRKEEEPAVYEKDARRAEFAKRAVCRRCGQVSKLYRNGLCAECLSGEEQ